MTVSFFRKLQEVTTRIHATANLDETMLDLGLDFCDLFDSDGFTLYAVTPERDSIVSRVKTGLSSFRDLRLPIGTSSVAGGVKQLPETLSVAPGQRLKPQRPRGKYDALVQEAVLSAAELCTHCRAPYTPGEEEIQALLAEFCEELQATESFKRDPEAARAAVLQGWRERYTGADGRFMLYRAVGCTECTKGYRGRAALLAQALEDGMLTLKMDGIEKVLAGITDIKMVRAVCVK